MTPAKMADNDDEMEVMTGGELHIVYKKLFDMRPVMTIGKFNSKSLLLSFVP